MKLLSGLLLSSIVQITVSVYPWDGNVHERSWEILNHVRDQLQLEIVGDTIPKAFEDIPSNQLILRNLQGVPFIAKMKIEDPNDFKTQYSYLFDERQLAAKLEGVCSVLPIEYWNYEWCHRREFSQFHLEQEGRKVIKAPDWSLGKYSRSIVVRDRADVANENAPITKLVEYFQGGQICHENNQLRSVEVHVQCCDGLGIPNAIPSEAYQSLEKSSAPFPLAVLNRITEPELCTYQATVCSPLLCVKLPDGYDINSDHNEGISETIDADTSILPRSTASHSPSVKSKDKKHSKISKSKSKYPKFAEVMKLINTTCLAKQEEWWTYELCFNKGVRQVRFNLEQAVTAEGTVIQKQVLANQYILGLPPLDLYANEEELVSRTQDKVFSSSASSAKSPRQSNDLYSKEREMVETFGMISPLFKMTNKQPNHLALEFVNGTPCDLQNLNRTVIVELFCGLMNTMVQVREDSTCRYRMKVELSALCSLPGFAPVKENVTSIVLKPLYDPAKFKGNNPDSEEFVQKAPDERQSSNVPQFLEPKEPNQNEGQSQGDDLTVVASGEGMKDNRQSSIESTIVIHEDGSTSIEPDSANDFQSRIDEEFAKTDEAISDLVAELVDSMGDLIEQEMEVVMEIVESHEYYDNSEDEGEDTKPESTKSLESQREIAVE